MKNVELIQKTAYMLIVNELNEAKRIYNEEGEEAARKYVEEVYKRIEERRKEWIKDISEVGRNVGKWEEELNYAQQDARTLLVSEFNWYVLEMEEAKEEK